MASEKEWVIGLYAYPVSPPKGESFARFHAIVSKVLARLGLQFTHVAADGGAHTGKLVNSASAAGKRILNSEFNDIRVLNLTVSPKGSKQPAYDRIFTASLSSGLEELLLCFAVNEGVAAFLSDTFDSVLGDILELESWACGYAFCDSVNRQPEFHILAIDNGRLTKNERQALMRWYTSRPFERQSKLRNVYPLTIISEKLLNSQAGSVTLAEFIKCSSGTELITVGGLSCWRVPEAQLAKVRQELSSMGALIEHP